MTLLATKLTVVGLAIAIVLPTGANAFQFNSTMKNHAVFEEVMLNPQPLPPKYLKRKKQLSFGDTVSINPQPLPPKLFFGFGG